MTRFDPGSSEPGTRNPGPQNPLNPRTSEPWNFLTSLTLGPGPGVLNSQLYMRYPSPLLLNPKPLLLNSKPLLLNPKP